MAHRPRGPVVLTGYTSRPDSLSYFLSELKTIRESQIFEPYEVEVLDHEEGEKFLCLQEVRETACL